MSRLFLAVFLMFLSISPVMAFDDYMYPYAGVTLGTALTSVTKISDSSGSLDTDFNPGYMAGLTAGLSFKTEIGESIDIDRIRTEAEIGYRSNNLVKFTNAQGQSINSSGRASVTNFMLNVYLENTKSISSEIPLNIFLTAGAGAAMASIIDKSASNTQLAYQGGVGIGYEVTENITLDVSYKYMGTTTFKFGDVNAKYGSHNILLGARFAFK